MFFGYDKDSLSELVNPTPYKKEVGTSLEEMEAIMKDCEAADWENDTIIRGVLVPKITQEEGGHRPHYQALSKIKEPVGKWAREQVKLTGLNPLQIKEWINNTDIYIPKESRDDKKKRHTLLENDDICIRGWVYCNDSVLYILEVSSKKAKIKYNLFY